MNLQEAYIKILNENYNNVFDEDTTGSSDYDEWWEAGGGYIKYMTPYEYYKTCDDNSLWTNSSVDYYFNGKYKNNNFDVKIINKYIEQIKNGNKLSLPVICLAPECMTQDGFHRVTACKELGIEDIPVVIITETTDW